MLVTNLFSCSIQGVSSYTCATLCSIFPRHRPTWSIFFLPISTKFRVYFHTVDLAELNSSQNTKLLRSFRTNSMSLMLHIVQKSCEYIHLLMYVLCDDNNVVTIQDRFSEQCRVILLNIKQWEKKQPNVTDYDRTILRVLQNN